MKKGFPTGDGYIGFVEGRYILFASESDYYEYTIIYPSDPYDVSDYDDPDDFAEEWAEEFGDGNYDDAYDYWESEWD